MLGHVVVHLVDHMSRTQRKCRNLCDRLGLRMCRDASLGWWAMVAHVSGVEYSDCGEGVTLGWRSWTLAASATGVVRLRKGVSI
ncbi:MAG: hypothetical protein ACKV0T_15170 [Planctomycetales bacterium]